MANATLERIIKIDANRRRLDMNDSEVSVLLCMASLINPLRSQVFDKMNAKTHKPIIKHFQSMLDKGYITEHGEQKAANHKFYPKYKLTNLGEHTVAKVLGLVKI